jgi:hypothetical protein
MNRIIVESVVYGAAKLKVSASVMTNVRFFFGYFNSSVYAEIQVVAFCCIRDIMSQLQLLEEDAFLHAKVALNQYGLRRDKWRAFMNGPAWAFENCMRTQFMPIASRFCVICQMGINGLLWGKFI